MEKNLTILMSKITLRALLLFGMFMHLGSALSLANEVSAQKLGETYIHLRSSDPTLQTLMETVEKQTDFDFSYSGNMNLDQQVHLSEGRMDLESVLLEISRQSHVQFKQINYTIAISPIEREIVQAITVTGKVTDNTGEPLPGASVVVVGTTNGAITDLDGHYTITVEEGATLAFSFIGYMTYTTEVGTRTVIDVVLEEDSKSLDEVVVVGYGEQKRVTVTGAVSAISGKEMIKSPTTNLTNSFAGRIAGVTALERSGEPGSSGAEILIRGVSTLGNNSPLVVIDGIPDLTGGLNRIDPNDVESISVLKDASASIYGARAANGVILVTTKRGEEGRPVINYSFNQGFVSPTRMPEMADASLYAQLTNEILGYAGQPAKYTDEDIQKFRDGSDAWTHPNTDWIGAVIKPISLQNRHNLSLRGGSERVKYYVSIGSLYEDAVYKNSATNYGQQNIRVNLDGKVNDYLELKFDVQGRSTKRNYAPVSAGSIFRFIQRGRPTETAIWPNGLPGPDIEQGNNPVVTTTEEAGYNHHDIALGNVLLGYKFKIPGVEGLFLDGNYSASKEVLHRKNFVKPWTLYTWGGYDDNGEPTLIPGERGVNDPELRERYDLTTQVLFNSKINYERNFGKHFINVFVGYEQNLDYGSGINGFRRNFISPVVDQLFAGGQDLREITGSAYEGARRNYFGRASYRMDETYMVDFSFRYDGSQNFPKDKRYGFFPGISAGWVLSNEAFLRDNSFVDFLKLRASWGQMGNDRVANFQYLSNYGFGSGAIFGDNLGLAPSIYPTRIANPNITWEVANTTNIAVESEFFDGALGVELDYFYSKRTNILIPRSASIPEYTGMVLPDENLGEVENKGFDLQLTHQNQIGEWNFVVAGNVSYARNKILFWDESENVPDYQKYTGARIGSELYYNVLGVFRDEEHVNSLPHWSGAREGDLIFQDFNNDGQINALDRVRHNPDIPELSFGLNMNVNYRNFNFTMLWQGAAGASQYVRTESGLIGNFPLAFVENRWTENNRDTDVPRVFDSREYWITQRNSHWLWDTDYLRLKTVQLGYSFNRSLLERLKVQNLNVYVSGQNLFTIDNVKIFDPEIPGGSGHYYPQVRIINLGLNITL